MFPSWKWTVLATAVVAGGLAIAATLPMETLMSPQPNASPEPASAQPAAPPPCAPGPQDAGGGMPEMSPEAMAGMQRWMEACTPNENHAKLAAFVGEWDTVMRMWMEGPGSKPYESKGTCKASWLIEGRWVESVSRTEGMMGMPAVSHHGRFGYDVFKKKFVWSQVDSLTTAMLTAEGFLDREGKALHLYGPMDEPMDGTHDKPVRYTIRFSSPDSMLLEVHDFAIGETNTKVMEIAYTRRK